MTPFPQFIKNIIDAGGLVQYVKNNAQLESQELRELETD
jgi:hypothetical protein